jgi:putative ABC transport system permease protein
MVLTLAIGVAASIATLTILHVMSGDPIPHKSDRLLVPLVDNGPLDGYKPGDKPTTPAQLPRRRQHPQQQGGERRTAIYGIGVAVEPERKDIGAFNVRGLAPTATSSICSTRPSCTARAGARPTTRRRRRGGAEPQAGGKLYGDADPVGKRMRWAASSTRSSACSIPGTWCRASTASSAATTAPSAKKTNCSSRSPTPSAMSAAQRQHQLLEDVAPGFQAFLDSECTWIQGWIEIRSAGPRRTAKLPRQLRRRTAQAGPPETRRAQQAV